MSRPLQLRLLLLSLGAVSFSGSAGAQIQNSPQRSPELATLVTKGSFEAPQFSPGGHNLLVSGPRRSGLAEVRIKDGHVTWLLDEARVGVHSHYRADGSIAFLAKRAGKTRSLSISKTGAITQIHEAAAKAFARGNQIFLRSNGGIEQVSTGDKFFAPVLSADHSKVAFTGLETGIHIYDIRARKHIWVGPGTAPSWSPDSKTLAYERTEDDGHRVVGSNIWLWTPAAGAHVLARTNALIERHPSWSPDGKRIAFDDDHGSIYIMRASK